MSSVFPIDTKPVNSSVGVAVVYSVLFHAAVVLVGTVGLPYIRKPILPPQPISVEIVEIDDITQTNKRSAAPKPVEEKKPDPVKDKPPAPPKVETKTPPKTVPPKPPKPLEKKVVKPKETPPPPDKQDLKKPEKKKEEEVAAQQDEFASLLKNLQDGGPQAAAQESDVPKPEEVSPLAKFSQRITHSEMDAMQAALNHQFAYCWNLSAGAKYAEDIVVQIRLFINPDRTVRDVRIVDQLRYNTDSFYRAAADNVLRAVRHPSCQVLDLPQDKYEFWKDSIFNFNPSQML